MQTKKEKNTSIQVFFTKLWQHQKYKNIVIFFMIVGLFSTGFFVGDYLQQNRIRQYILTFQNIRDVDRNFSYINPLLGVISAPATDIGMYTDIKDDISDYLEEEKKEGGLYDYSFYFKDLTSPMWYGINEDASFAPASLFKLPIAIVAYRQGEADPSFLNKVLVYTQVMKDANTAVTGNEVSSLVVGRGYSVEELVKIMLELSDNGAKDLLSSALEPKYVSELFDVMSLVDPMSSRSYEISSRKYALFLRLLYNGSYLHSRHSEYLLSILAKSAFKDGLVAGVPKDTVVAHKFGTYETQESIEGNITNVSILHDCGIVYHEETPYVICFMTKGKDIPTLLKIISHVSKMVYDDTFKDR
jgi:beta-lactamase class A